jgi:16S rRNA (cytosine1402-N4)-methyltransferase
MIKHIPVLLDNVMTVLDDIRDRTIVDCTFGAGGYTRAFLNAGANVIAFDRDTNVIDDANEIKQRYGSRFKFINAPFSDIDKLKSTDFDDVVFDLGISSMQIDNAERGFSFRFDAPLDMRMDNRLKINAVDLIKNSSVEELANILYEYGDVKKSKLLANVFKKELPTTTFQLRDLIKNPHDVAPVFQALRIAVNDEMGQIKSALSSVHNLLRPGGRCVCVTFHSVEDRIVKNTFRQWTSVSGDPRLPSVSKPEYKLLKVYMPSDAELENNPRARSAHLRGVEKL